MKKYMLILLFSAIIFTGCQSPEKVIEQFEVIIEEQDAEGLYKLVNVEEDVYWSEKEAKDLLDYYSEDKSAYEEQLKLLHDQRDAFKEKTELVNETGVLYFNDKKKLFVRTYDVSLSENSFVEFEELVVSVLKDVEMNKTGGSDERIAIGLFGPGKYHIKGHAKYGHVTLEDEAEFLLFDERNFSGEIELDLKGEAATVFSTDPEAVFYIDDNKMEQDISADSGAIIQPLVNGLHLQSKSEYAWGELVSEAVEYTGEGTRQQDYDSDQSELEEGIDFTPYIFADELEREEIAHIITDFNEQLLKGLAENDPSYLDDTIATDKAKAGYDSDFELLDSVAKGEVQTSKFPPGMTIAFIGHYEGELIESIIDFAHAENIKEEETGEDLLMLKVNLKTNFYYIPQGFEDTIVDRDSINYLEPFIKLKKENNQWMIAEQLIDLKSGNSESALTGEQVVRTKVK